MPVVSKKNIGKVGVTPMIAQYQTLKERAGECLLFYRMGDFFELFFEDAKIAAACLDIALTRRGVAHGEDIPMCGVPVHAAESYLARLIRAGHRVAIAEQTEDPAQARARGGAKALVARDIVRFVTAGTLTEDSLLDGRASNLLVALVDVGARGETALAAADISTGRFEVLSLSTDALDSEIARLAPSEILVAEGAATDRAWSVKQLVVRPSNEFSSQAGARRLQEYYHVSTVDGFGDFSRGEYAAMGALLAYLEHVAQGGQLFLRPPMRRCMGAHMAIDAATRESLELVRTISGVRENSLLATIDCTITSVGARLLAEDIATPLTDRTAIEARLDLVSWFATDPLLRAGVREDMRALPDAVRALGRLVAGRGTPRDLAQLRDALSRARQLREKLTEVQGCPPLLNTLLPALDGHGALVDELDRALVESPPLDVAQGGTIAEGYDAALDSLRGNARDGRRAIAGLEGDYRAKTGITALKIKHNAVLGYHIEVPARHADSLMTPDSHFTHRQTLAGVVRFNSLDLHEAAARVVQAGAHALAAEEAHLETLIQMATQRREAIAETCAALARIDVAAALADYAMSYNWHRPQISSGKILTIAQGRHPVVEAALAKEEQRFVPNDLSLDDKDSLWLITGPNMGGKSTFLRQNALIVILAQMGSFVPAHHAEVGIVDRLFSRVGASDNLARGRSTFMVEMVETAAILAQAGPDSLVILDEVGRGTSTYDGLALAWAVVEAVHNSNHSRCLFATHYHELTQLKDSLPALSLHHVRAREWQGNLVLLHEMVAGTAERSYGLAVARLAGVPSAVVRRAENVLARLEDARQDTGGLSARLESLPLFSEIAEIAEIAEDAKESKGSKEAKEVAMQSDPLRDMLAEVEPDSLTPRDALDLLYRLKILACAAGD